MVEGSDVVQTVLEEAVGLDAIVTGATQEGLFTNLLIGTTAEQIARRAKVTTIIVRRRSRLLHSLMRKTVLEPTAKRQA
jgi:nucleotide-binding universal stress UspA family protein